MSSKKVRASVDVLTVDEDDDDNLSAGYSISSSVSGASLVGTGQTSPTYCEITSDRCRAVTTSATNGVEYLCAKAGTCGSKGHAALRHSSSRGRTGHYKVAGYKKATQQATRVFADSRLGPAEYLQHLADDRARNRQATETFLAEAQDDAAPDMATRELLMSPGATTRRTARASLKKAPVLPKKAPVVAVLTQRDSVAESYSLLEDEGDDDTIDTDPGGLNIRTPSPHVDVDLHGLEMEQARLASRAAEVAKAMKDAMAASGVAAARRTTPVTENSRNTRQVQEPSVALPPRFATLPSLPEAPLAEVVPPPAPAPAPSSGASPEVVNFLVNQVQDLQAKLEAMVLANQPAPVSLPVPPPEPRSPVAPIPSTKVYAVAQGRDISSRGVYATWAAASPHVHGVSSAVFKKCSTEAVGWKFIQDFLDNQLPVEEEPVPVPVPAPGPAGPEPAGYPEVRRVNFGIPAPNNPATFRPSVTGVGFGVDVSTGTGTHAFGVRTNLGNEMLMKLAPESITVAQRARLGEQMLDSVAQPGMSFTAESDVTGVEAFTDAIEGLTVAADRRSAGSYLGGHKDGNWRKNDHVSLRKITDVETLQEHMELLQSAQKADLELTKTSIEEVYTRCGYSPEVAEHLALTGGIYRVSVDTYTYYVGLHIHLLSLALTSGFAAAQLELDHHVKKLGALRKRLPSRIQVLMANYTYLRDLMRTGWSCLAIELLHRKALQDLVTLRFPQAAGPNPGPANEPCGWCGSGLHGYNQPVNSCPWKPKSRTQAKAAAREAMRNLARGVAYAPPPADGG
jgi:hypothetical protein